uniref:RRM domain-containing protein n=1 Tax=Ciona savignyi TaxID=51511 RepID=H2YTF9_CIOSA
MFDDVRDAEDALYAMDRKWICGRYIEVQFAAGDRKTPNQMRSKDDSPDRYGGRRSYSRSPRRRYSRSRSRSTGRRRSPPRRSRSREYVRNDYRRKSPENGYSHSRRSYSPDRHPRGGNRERNYSPERRSPSPDRRRRSPTPERRTPPERELERSPIKPHHRSPHSSDISSSD